MSGDKSAETPSFKEMEHSGWEVKAGSYGGSVGPVTGQAVDPLLDAAGVGAGSRVLDVASGPGYGAGRAAARGAEAVGLDFSPAMVAEASGNFPDAEFRQGDGEDLPFANESFDAVICPFGLLHMPEPEKAVAEACRVLRPGGRYAFTVWATPDRHQFLGLVLKAIEAHGDMDVGLPPAPPFFRFSDADECRAILGQAGFADADVTEVPLTWRPGSAQAFIDMIHAGTVRTAMLLEHQAPDAVDRIHRAILEGAERFKTSEGYEVAWPAVLTSARKD